MTDDSLSSEELVIGRLVGRLADSGTRHREPNTVAQEVIANAAPMHFGWMPLAIGASLALVVAALAVAANVFAPVRQGSIAATAQVNGLTYDISVARSLDVSGARLTPFAQATQNSGFITEDATAYQVEDLDPQKVLVMKLIPGERDGGGPIGPHLLLVRGGGFSLLCPYFIPGHPANPTVCD